MTELSDSKATIELGCEDFRIHLGIHKIAAYGEDAPERLAMARHARACSACLRLLEEAAAQLPASSQS